MERETSLRVGSKQKKKTTKTRQQGEVFPSEAGRGYCMCTKQPLELFLSRSFGKPFHFYCNAQEPKSKAFLDFLNGHVLVLTRKSFCMMPRKRVTLPLPSRVYTVKWMLAVEVSWGSWSVSCRTAAPQEPTPWVQGGYFPGWGCHPHLRWQGCEAGQDCTDLGHPHLPLQGCVGRGSSTPRQRRVCVTPTAWEGCAYKSMCVWYTLGSVTEGGLEICSCMVPFVAGIVVVWLISILNVLFNDCQFITYH